MNYVLHLPNTFFISYFGENLETKGERNDEKECKISNEFSYDSAYLM